jgi:hypothetical protein
MLNKSNISKIKPMSEEWLEAKKGKFSSSEIHFLTGKYFLSEGCLNYIYRKVGEVLTNKPAMNFASEINTEATIWGLVNEADAVRKFAQAKGLEFVICQQLISIEGTRFGSTPDGIVVHSESTDQLQYNVSPLEVKCPPTFQNYIGLALCKTPQDVKREESKYYWQVLDQMDNCDAMVGYFAAYHPDFKKGNLNIVEFRRMQPTGIENDKEVAFPLARDLKFLKDRKAMAVAKFDELVAKFQEMGSY